MNSKPPSANSDNTGITRQIRSHEGTQKPDQATNQGEDSSDLRFQYERDQSSDSTNEQPRDVIRQAHKDIEAGLVDTDLRGTPGLDAQKQRELLEREKRHSEENSGKQD